MSGGAEHGPDQEPDEEGWWSDVDLGVLVCSDDEDAEPFYVPKDTAAKPPPGRRWMKFTEDGDVEVEHTIEELPSFTRIVLPNGTTVRIRSDQDELRWLRRAFAGGHTATRIKEA